MGMDSKKDLLFQAQKGPTLRKTRSDWQGFSWVHFLLCFVRSSPFLGSMLSRSELCQSPRLSKFLSR